MFNIISETMSEINNKRAKIESSKETKNSNQLKKPCVWPKEALLSVLGRVIWERRVDAEMLVTPSFCFDFF
jgi:hypothetical protein